MTVWRPQRHSSTRISPSIPPSNKACTPFDHSEFFDGKLDFSFHFTAIRSIHPQRQISILQIGILNWSWIVRSIWSIDRILDWLHEPLTKSFKVTSWKQIRFRIFCSSWSAIWSNFRLKNPDSDWSKGMHPKCVGTLGFGYARAVNCRTRLFSFVFRSLLAEKIK